MTVRKQLRTRAMKREDEKRKYAAFECEKSDVAAVAQMQHKAYESYTVTDYLRKMGVDVKGEISDG